jgi:hypothetical protein
MTGMFAGSRLGRLAAAALLTLTIGARPVLAGDRVTELTTMLSSSSEKTRLQAVLSLSRLGDKRAVKPLVTALQDPNAQIRAVAATSLGKIGNQAALPALRTTALDDTDEKVRKTARDAFASVTRVNHLDNDLPDAPVTADAPPAIPPSAATSAATQPAPVATQARKTGFGRSPHAVQDRPDLYVMVKGCTDDSPGKTDKVTRKQHGDVLAASIKGELKRAPQVTMAQPDAERWGLDARMVDVSVTKLDVGQAGNYMEVSVELRLAISDNTGKMLSFLSGGAKVQVPMSKYKPQFLPNIRKEAIEGAMSGMMDKLLVHLRQITTT